jgi:hypothetical protein
MSVIEFTENTQTKELKTALDSDNLLVMSYYFFGAIGALVAIGLSWDLWEYRKRNRAQSGEGEGIGLFIIHLRFYTHYLNDTIRFILQYVRPV